MKIWLLLLLIMIAPFSYAFNAVGSIAKAFKGVPLKHISTAALSQYPRQEQIKFLTGRAVELGRITSYQSIRLRSKFSKIPDGEIILLSCLKDALCDPKNALRNLDKYKNKTGSYPQSDLARMVAIDDLYMTMALRHPDLSPQQLKLKAGALAERLMDRNFRTSGWKRVEGEVGRNGFDGLYVKLDSKGRVKKVMVVESKYGPSAKLGTTVDGARQLSRQWSKKKINALIRKNPENNLYPQIKQHIDDGAVKYRVYRVRVINNKIYQSIEGAVQQNSKGVWATKVTGPESLRSANLNQNVIINLSNPSNSYQKRIIDDFNKILLSF